jgi:hypothetical protein
MESEGRGDYRAHNREGGSLGTLGRYQFRKPALQDIGLVDKNGKWTCATISGARICSASDFLDNPRVQDIALARYIEKLRQQMTANGVLNHVGTSIDIGRMQFPINDAGLYAAAHFAGAHDLRKYLDHVAANGGRSMPRSDREREIERRLAKFLTHRSPRSTAR